MGSGTTLAVAGRLRRRSIGVDLNPEHAALARERIDLAVPANLAPSEAVA